MKPLLALAALLTLAAAKPDFDPRVWKANVTNPTQVLTLGTPHLSQLPVKPTPAMLEPLLAKLAAYRPDVITHEGLSGEQCAMIEPSPARYPDVFKDYCWPGEAIARATGLNVAQAMAAVETTLADWPISPAPAQRRRLAMLFLAAGDRPSAMVQWLRLPATERRTGDGLGAAMVAILRRDNPRPNETYDVAVVLAARLGHDRVFAVDDHTADSIQAAAGEGFDPALQAHWASIRMPLRDAIIAREKALNTGLDLLELYRVYNRPETPRTFVEADYRDALSGPAPYYGRQYVAWFETRNLRMVANIRAAFANHPGARVLNIVGASHKPYYDAYLDMMSEVVLVDAEEVLR